MHPAKLTKPFSSIVQFTLFDDLGQHLDDAVGLTRVIWCTVVNTHFFSQCTKCDFGHNLAEDSSDPRQKSVIFDG